MTIKISPSDARALLAVFRVLGKSRVWSFESMRAIGRIKAALHHGLREGR